MPNHVVNELVWRGITDAQRAELLANIVNADGRVDFSILVPQPLNIWAGSVGVAHEKAFGDTALDWSRRNWGTKWNAYSCLPIEQTEGELRIVFETAWRPPYPWLAALLNRFKLGFQHGWHDEGCTLARVGHFEWRDDGRSCDDGPHWREDVAGDADQRRLFKLQWGVETSAERDAGDEDAAP